ncbi:type II toxin-antitoxin system RelE/ParE family toxin [Bosea caraganae]|uniref:Type II toxin-antitoxin system RelE/ParE family toxin n=1 Tax=Bosea caraganae TaxID=2763117 RepID=A0A370KZL0_9HYPH|nr:type II toxin-antitoxin system RelE/ParE family toxin [Bosea caraganae]RDJ20449.1 type II toxin-antitoxin system RelE/ParE family toxin [Bosea caraganae]RDJ29964.1 type II toxin-antitoxin system RelE/ParE family toxin [Bosea caraganae]
MAGEGEERTIPVFFYRTKAGNEPVRDWLRELDAADRQVIGLDLLRVQTQWPIGMPVCRSLGGGLWEVRSTLPSRRIARVLFFMDDGEIYVVHGFIKKSQATPAADLDLARARMKEVKP